MTNHVDQTQISLEINLEAYFFLLELLMLSFGKNYELMGNYHLTCHSNSFLISFCWISLIIDAEETITKYNLEPFNGSLSLFP